MDASHSLDLTIRRKRSVLFAYPFRTRVTNSFELYVISAHETIPKIIINSFRRARGRGVRKDCELHFDENLIVIET